MGQSSTGSGTGAITQLGNIGGGGYQYTGGDLNQQKLGANLNLAGAGAAGGSSLNALTTTEGNINLTQESPQAIAALLTGAQNALTFGNSALQGGFALSSKLGQNALDDARSALTPADARVYQLIEIVAGLALAALLIWYYSKRG